ncbi:MAG: hypothetical protein WC152_05275, partial [Candidatus Izemoplasmatales bacterium]
LIYDLGVNTTDHRGVDLTQAIDPTTVNLVIQEQVTTKSISLGTNDLPLIVFSFDKWLNYIDPAGSNDIGAANIAGIIMVEGANGIAALDDTAKVFSGGYSVLVDSEMNIKYIVDRWGHEWNATDGWTTNSGTLTFGLNHLASYFKPYLAEGDMLILGSQYAKDLPEGTYYRNFLGNAVIKELVSGAASHRYIDITTAIDPTTVVLTIKETTSVLRVGTALIDYKEFDLDNWMLYAESDPGADGISGLVYVTGLEKISSYDNAARIFSGGTVVLLDSNMAVKYVVDRWSNVWTQAEGWTKIGAAGDWSYGTNVYASYFNTLVEEGDVLVMASQYSRGLTTGAQYRDVLDNQILFDLGADIITLDHRGVTDLTTAIDPTTVIINVVALN